MNIAMVSDFFYPQPGGVELHMYHLSQKLIDRGHSVVVITHSYGGRTGVRVLTNGLKVYYIPFAVVMMQCTLPAVFSAFPILRNIFIRENIEIVHGHGSLSFLCLEAIMHAKTMGLKTIFTDHSLFGFATVSSIVGNKLLTFTLTEIGHVICVSHTCKENTVLRSSLDPNKASVIPNAVVASDFTPEPNFRDENTITIVIISRLFPNKGADLLTAIIPRICAYHEKIRFIIAGDGPKFIDFEQMVEKYQLQDKVQLIGSIKHEEVRNVMVKGHIYLHASLTEAFGTVLVEAASCGLFVVTTNVGGIPEVLPNHMTAYALPEEESIVSALTSAIDKISAGKIHTSGFHNQVKEMYDWRDVAQRTELVYINVKRTTKPTTTLERIKKYYIHGFWGGKLFVLCLVVDIFILTVLDFWYPRDKIDRAAKWPHGQKYAKPQS
ncbi:Glycosylphosphatidylinositol (GPI) biosynthesis protein [Komagataella phaffii CBS 7435]|uniref:Phosphatidylinositol N-acetylglucosaminyltransferase GPI3 subunit n=2 Tax=Komagataella phaffii TaxID=460519 RepID=C4R094_KOMPG|nr:UDP-GlcNAc-binding and catalytic subunit of the enzyme that mediates the first step in GPI synthesis [Komagataella phaffii GS115]AOA62864.1 GQ67_00339T0 [Komagataella phaffii]CAH2448577.1 Glycosylphosphatidylinositol (GPI) biosynthesis protein [Komagataella phaffii CBS 7435]AOA66944.1 GQ68_01050T0 [Komagataella phaffii GS115]CAY68918.1 UDP-GlcNAc-binding and catalytic subunit of the enzyme that mediates the first step in GPI synthesis [Komagataella phaffii GS115]CCA38678.1 Glycosylphosphati